MNQLAEQLIDAAFELWYAPVVLAALQDQLIELNHPLATNFRNRVLVSGYEAYHSLNFVFRDFNEHAWYDFYRTPGHCQNEWFKSLRGEQFKFNPSHELKLKFLINLLVMTDTKRLADALNRT